ncbi:efflux transporter outer membrane subunit [Pseudomonas syringae]|uniref:efflux transporter outer membrane subunit n=1 Tax=Pseudomonas syringae TaxID=317 RepID=UPI003F74DB4D
MNKLPLLMIAGVLAGCSLAPEFKRPEPPVPLQFPGVNAAPANAVLPDSRLVFRDPRLQRLIELGLAANRDLRVATLNIEQARAQYRIQRADLLPSVDATGAFTRQRGQTGFAATEGQGQSQVTNLYNVGIGISTYELDLFGRVRNLTDATLNEYQAIGETREAVALSLVSEIATAYLNQRAASERIEVTQLTLKSREEGLALIRQRLELGVGSDLDLSQAETLVEGARSDLAVLDRTSAQADNTLALLIGQPMPTDLPGPLPLAEQGLNQTIAPGLPSELLSRRPDIRAAERRLEATFANIGAARAAFFPRISLTASTGSSSTELNDLFSGGSGTWSFAPQIQIPIFNYGRNRAALDVAKVRRELGVAQYEKTIQVAFREVADELVAREPLQRQLAAQQRQLDAAQRSLTLADQRYRSGLDGFLVKLDSERTVYGVQSTLVEARLQLALSQVNLFKSLGGGWSASR